METTTLTIHVPKAVGLALEKKARTSGKPVEEYVESILEIQTAEPSLETAFAPIRDGFEKSGMTEEELAELIDREIKAVRAERKRRSQEPE